MNTKIIALMVVLIAGMGVYLFLQRSTESPTNSSKPIIQQETINIMTNRIATITTNKGVIKIELFEQETPITAGNFTKLAEAKYFDGIKFHRVIPDFMIQGGDPLTKDDAKRPYWGTGGPGYTIKDEFVAGLSNVRGTISMANAGPNTGGSQFFINVADNTFLDAKHAVFGRVVSGMEVTDSIVNVPRDTRDTPIDPIVIQSVVLGVE